MSQKRYLIGKYEGVYGYDSMDTRFNGKQDVCYYITLKKGKTKVWEKVGWASEGYTPKLADELRAKRIRDARHMGEVKTSKDIRAEQEKINRSLKEIKEHYFNSSKGTAIKGRKTDLNRWQLHLAHLEGKSVKDLSPFEIERIKHNMKGLAPATIDHALRLLRRIINHGEKENLCPRLDFQIERPTVNNTRTEFLSPEEASRLVETLNNWPRQDIARMVKLAMFTGMRRGELFKLRQDHLDFQHGLITIADPKGKKDAVVPMSPLVRDLLQQQIDFLNDNQMRRARRYRNTNEPVPYWQDHGFLFPGPHGGQRGDCSAINRIKAAAALPAHFRPFHGLRHHYAVLLASSGEFNLDQIGQLLTHKSSDITRRYAHYLPASQQKAANRAAEIIAAQATTGQEVKKKIVNIGNR